MELKRDLLEHLKKWKESPKHKPILLKGARQVGKSRGKLRVNTPVLLS
jgi:predicted AAA+ superfamily ATPase